MFQTCFSSLDKWEVCGGRSARGSHIDPQPSPHHLPNPPAVSQIATDSSIALFSRDLSVLRRRVTIYRAPPYPGSVHMFCKLASGFRTLLVDTCQETQPQSYTRYMHKVLLHGHKASHNGEGRIDYNPRHLICNGYSNITIDIHKIIRVGRTYAIFVDFLLLDPPAILGQQCGGGVNEQVFVGLAFHVDFSCSLV